jgi:hypothetical protein
MRRLWKFAGDYGADTRLALREFFLSSSGQSSG